MAINWGSNTVNGQLVPQPPSSAFFPLTMGAQYRGPGYWPRQGSYQVPPVVPSAAMAAQMSPNSQGSGTAQGSVTTGPPMSSASPWHPFNGTIMFAVGALVLGLFALHYIHYGG